MRKNKLILIFGLINLMPIFFDLLSVYFGSYDNSISKYAPMNLDEIIGYFIYSLIYLLIFSLAFYFFSSKIYIIEINVNHRDFGYCIKIAYIVYVFCLLLSLIILYDIYLQGVISYMISTRSGQVKIGILIYFILIFFPIIIGVLLHKQHFFRWAAFGIVILVMLNLITGFRILLFFGLAIITLLHYKKIHRMNKYVLFFLGFCFLLLMYYYQEYREVVQGALDGSSRGIVDSLNRSIPIHTMKLAFDNSVSINFIQFLELLILPLIIIMNSVLSLNEFYLYDPIELSERLYSGYIYWRNGYYGIANGFSINNLAFSFILMDGAGIFIIPLVSAAICSLGAKLYQSGSVMRRVAGTLLIIFTIFSIMESFVEAWKLLVYSMIFIVLIITTGSILRIIIFGGGRRALSENVVSKVENAQLS